MGEVFSASLGDVFRADPLTPSSSRQARAASTEPLRTLPSSSLTFLAALAAEDDDALCAAGASFQAEQLLALVRFEEMVGAELARRVAVFDRTGAVAATRSRTAKGFLQTHGQLSDRVAKQLVERARRLDTLRTVRTALTEGELSASQAEVIAHEITDVEDPQARAQAEDLLVGQAKELHLGQLKQAARQVRAHLVEEQEPAVKDAPALFRSTARLSQTGTSDDPFWVLTAELSAVAGEKLRVALEAAMGTPVEGETRTHPERMGDALEAVADLALGCDKLPTTGGQRPHFTVIADLDALREECPAHPTFDGDDDPEASEAADDDLSGLLHPVGVATSTRGFRLPRWQARKESCDCRLRVILTKGQGKPVSIGRAARTVPAHLRDAVIARDRHCVWPGCTRPPTWCEAHHLTHWADGGHTSLNNLALLCGEHHTDLHHTGWELEMTNGRPRAVPPPDTPPPPNTRYPH
ncbi:HNH endonuclease signature motif containing protein [Streptacidiphilus rugosus]|uniref:HNH endonuclease signature motif containing protein n=1 Tax=Streptacidiphilus rugosus TaxID=405783 RepID=UPI00068B0C5D|nr:HNH endonuclease signature motif containing protein [Streptacidiphilus rugosus]